MIFVDTSAIIALTIVQDDFHQKSVEWKILHQDETFTTSNLVVMETVSWIRHKYGKSLAERTSKYLISGEGLQIERVTMDDEQEAWKLFYCLDGRGFSMIDTTSFTLMRRLKVNEAFTFDEDFKKLNFTVYP